MNVVFKFDVDLEEMFDQLGKSRFADFVMEHGLEEEIGVEVFLKTNLDALTVDVDGLRRLLATCDGVDVDTRFEWSKQDSRRILSKIGMSNDDPDVIDFWSAAKRIKAKREAVESDNRDGGPSVS